MHRQPLKVGFVLLSNSSNPIPSTRIAVLNMLPFLREEGFDVRIVYDPDQDTETPDVSHLFEAILTQALDIVVFQKVHGSGVLPLVSRLRERGVATVFEVCDVISPAMAAATDASVAVTDFLRSQYPAALQPKIHVVHDGIERPEVCKTDWGTGRGSPWKPLRAVLVTSAMLHTLPSIVSPPNWLQVKILGAYAANPIRRLRETRWKMMSLSSAAERASYRHFLLNRRIRCQAWRADEVYEELRNADIGIIPIDTQPTPVNGRPPLWQLKSENRLTLKMCVGLPVVATPIPAYEPIVRHGVNGYFAQTSEQWAASLEELRNPATRERVGRAARESVLQRYSMQEQARRLIAVLRGLASETHSKIQ